MNFKPRSDKARVFKLHERFNQLWLNGGEQSLDCPEFKAASEIVDLTQIHYEAGELIRGRTHEVHLDIDSEPVTNAKTALFEELTAAGDLSVVKFDGDQDEIHRQIIARLLNGYRDNLPYWEKQRRFNEICEELIVNRIRRLIDVGQLPDSIVINTISDCPEEATELQSREIGYRLLNRKGFVRTHYFYRDYNGRLARGMEQASRSNSNDGSTSLLLKNNMLSRQMVNGATAALGLQFIATKDKQPDLAIDLMRWLDRQLGMNNLYGENRKIAFRRGRPDYADLRLISRERRRRMEQFTVELAEHETYLQLLHKSGQINYDQKLKLSRAKQKEVVERILVLDPSYVLDARGAEAVEHYEAASLALAKNDREAFIHHHQLAQEHSDPNAAIVCGGIGSEQESSSIFNKAKEDKENWAWKQGVCVVKTCPTRPGPTLVGPCNVCERCQDLFDHGKDPTTMGVIVEINSIKTNAKRSRTTNFLLAHAEAA